MEKPIVASYCTTFLKPEMLHIYRQVSALQRYESFIVTKERQCPERYPFGDIALLPEAQQPLLRRFYLKFIQRVPALHYRGEMEQLKELFGRRRADVMHVYFGHTGVHLRAFLDWWDRPSIVSFHGADVMPREHQPKYLGEMKQLFALVPLVLARSQSLAERLKANGCPGEKIRLNRTGIPLADFPLVQRDMPSDGAWHFVQTCRLISKKGLRTALHAFAEFRRDFPKATFSIVGEGPMREELCRLAAELGILEAVRFWGFLDQTQLNALYASAHLFLHPSELTEKQDQEGIPNSMLEAMSTGLPVAATLHGGIPEAVRDGFSGFLVPERDAQALAAALRRLVQAPELLQQMGRQASQSVREEFEQSRAVAKLEACYDEAIQIGKPPRMNRSI
ncbi:MAG: glycosyltransferase [Verrucomicrobia bacterium]|nr:glycosyltransferase [Verrucomicrobiota bacterium]